MINRRQWLYGAGIATLGAAAPVLRAASQPGKESAAQDKPLALRDYQPKSMLQVPETHVAKARFPVIDIHTHITVAKKYVNGVALSSDREYLGTPEELLAVMERKNLRTMVNVTGGYGQGLTDAIARYDRAHRRIRPPAPNRPQVLR